MVSPGFAPASAALSWSAFDTGMVARAPKSSSVDPAAKVAGMFLRNNDFAESVLVASTP